MGPLLVAGEGLADVAVATALLTHAGMEALAGYPAGGKSRLDPLLAKYNASASYVRWFVLRDLDHD